MGGRTEASRSWLFSSRQYSRIAEFPGLLSTEVILGGSPVMKKGRLVIFGM